MSAQFERAMVDMSATIVHHGHIRLLAFASSISKHVVVALTTDEEVLMRKGYLPELSFDERAEILGSIKFVDEVVPSPWLIGDDFISLHRIDVLVHGDDNQNQVSTCEIRVVPRTPGVSSSALREKMTTPRGSLRKK